MYQNAPADEETVRSRLEELEVCEPERDRLAELGAVAETNGQELVDAVNEEGFSNCLAPAQDPHEGQQMGVNNPTAIEVEGKVARGIRADGSSVYTRLFIGGTDQDAPPDAEVVHVNVLPEDMWLFTANGPRVLIDGQHLPLPDGIFGQVEGYHISYFAGHTEELIRELFRVTRSGATLRFQPSSTGIEEVEQALRANGFIDVGIVGLGQRTIYNGRPTWPTQVIGATRP